MSFYQKLKTAVDANHSLVCVGLDSELNRIPEFLKNHTYPLFEFNKRIIEATSDLVCAYKPQIAYYAACGKENELLMTLDFLRSHCPNIPIILDAKRGDIGATARMYAKEAFEHYQADAVTVNPFMGGDTLQPFLDYSEKGVIVLCRTSNPGAEEFQNLKSDGIPLFQIIARKAANEWNKNKNVLVVVGATYPEELTTVRHLIGDMPILLPGIGAQGGNIELAMKAGLTAAKDGLIVNSSRGIIYASIENDFAEKARAAAEELLQAINAFR